SARTRRSVRARPTARPRHRRGALRVLREERTLSVAEVDPLVRELVRGEAIARLSALGVRTPARLVDAALTARSSKPGGARSDRCLFFAAPDPWPEAVDGAALLYELAQTYRRFINLPDGGPKPSRSGSCSPMLSTRSTWPRLSPSARPSSAAARPRPKS